DVDDRVAVQRRHPPELPLLDEIGRLQAVPRREHAVAGGRRAASLYMAEHRHPRLEPGALLDLAGELLADAAQADVAELVELGLLRDLALLARVVRELGAPADRDDREVLATLVPLAQLGASGLDGDRLLGDQDH